jgi:hypothetical protein
MIAMRSSADEGLVLRPSFGQDIEKAANERRAHQEEQTDGDREFHGPILARSKQPRSVIPSADANGGAVVPKKVLYHRPCIRAGDL